MGVTLLLTDAVTTLANAPLVEVLTEIRWGMRNSSDEGEVSFEHSDDELQTLHDHFSRALFADGFVLELSTEHESEPFRPAYTFRRAADTWPVYQIGIGTLCINQGNEGYDWPQYKTDILYGLQQLERALTHVYREIPFIGAEMVYADAFFLGEDETFESFLLNKLRIKVHVPDQFWEAPFLTREPWSADFRVFCKLADPEGALTINVDTSDDMMGRRGVLMTTSVLSIGAPFGADQDLSPWLESAHHVQQHAFRTLIQPAFRRSFA